MKEMELDMIVREYIKETVEDWDDAEKAKSRFKAFSGQRCDWEPQFGFWRDLILNISRHFNLLFLSPSNLTNSWFNRSGLSPLCLDNVLVEMYKCGDILRISDLVDPKSGRLSQLFKRVIRSLKPSTSVDDILNDHLILIIPTIQDKAAQVLKSLSETHWTSSCIITMNKYQSLFPDQHQAYAVFSYLSTHGRAKYVSINSKQFIQGVKISLSSAPISTIQNVDYDMLQLFWTIEELQQQLNVIDKQHERSRQLALAALRSGDKTVALRNARQLKIASESREKIASFLNRVEEALHVVLDAESIKKVSEAIQVGAQAIKEHNIDVQEVQSCLREVDELMISQALVNKALESYSGDDFNVEEELQELELQIRDETLMVSTSLDDEDATRNAEKASTFTNSMSSAMAHLTLEDDTIKLHIQGSVTPRNPIGSKNEPLC